MNFARISLKDKIAILTLDKGKANAMNLEMSAELTDAISNLEKDVNTQGIIITGKEGFFSAGLDLVELYEYDQELLKKFFHSFFDFVIQLAACKKPVVAAINGHAPAAACITALCCDGRIMADGKSIIGINEVPLGLIVPHCFFKLYSFWTGSSIAYRYILEGKLLTPIEAREIGLVDEVVREASILTTAERQIRKFIATPTWQQTKLNLRKEVLSSLVAERSEAVDQIVRQWWQPSSRALMKEVIANLKAVSMV